MSLLLPLGLLGLIGIIILIIIYIIKPNYQTKYISSTFVWKLSLKYRKKKLPTSKLRNILLIICQVLIITLAAMILAKPVHMYLTNDNPNEAVAIIDSSASMLTETEGETRFERAVSKASSMANTVFSQEGLFSVIIADSTPSYLAQRVEAKDKDDMLAELAELVADTDNLACSYGTSDLDAAIALTEEILKDNPSTQIYLYTDKTISYVPEGVHVVSVAEDGEWNASILSARVEYVDNYYDIIVEVACYGRDAQIGVGVFVNKANAEDKNDSGVNVKNINFPDDQYQVFCAGGEVTKVVFKATNYDDSIAQISDSYFSIENDRFYSFDSIRVYLDELDNYEYDNEFWIYGGLKEVIKIQYSSTKPNTFVNSALFVIKNNYADKFDIQIVEEKGADPALEGYDYYIFEHYVPSKLPTDGVVILLDPPSAVAGLGVSYSGQISYNKVSQPLTTELEDHPLMKNINTGSESITVTLIDRVTNFDSTYEVLATVDNNPVLMVKNDGKSKIVLMNFSVHYSNMPVLVDFPYFFNNILNYFTPYTVESNAYEVYDEITLNSRSERLEVSQSGSVKVFDSFPATIVADEPQTYVITQTTYFGKEIEDRIYVRLPQAESNIYEVIDSVEAPYRKDNSIDTYDDLLFYFALALVFFVMCEWILKNRDN